MNLTLAEADRERPVLDRATMRVTAFATFAALVEAQRASGYVPTLRTRGRKGAARRAVLRLRSALEARGLRWWSA